MLTYSYRSNYMSILTICVYLLYGNTFFELLVAFVQIGTHEHQKLKIEQCLDYSHNKNLISGVGVAPQQGMLTLPNT